MDEGEKRMHKSAALVLSMVPVLVLAYSFGLNFSLLNLGGALVYLGSLGLVALD